MKISWTKNLQARIGALAAALLATAGLYGVIQAQPLGHSTTGALDAAASDPAASATATVTATGSPAPIVFPGRAGSVSSSATVPAPAATEPPNVSAPVSPGAPPLFKRPVTRTRAS